MEKEKGGFYMEYKITMDSGMEYTVDEILDISFNRWQLICMLRCNISLADLVRKMNDISDEMPTATKVRLIGSTGIPSVYGHVDDWGNKFAFAKGSFLDAKFMRKILCDGESYYPGETNEVFEAYRYFKGMDMLKYANPEAKTRFGV